MCFTIFILTSVADSLKVPVQHSGITNEAHLFGVSRAISSNGDAAPRAIDRKLPFIFIAIVVFIFKLIHHYLPTPHTVPLISNCRFSFAETRRLNRHNAPQSNPVPALMHL